MHKNFTFECEDQGYPQTNIHSDNSSNGKPRFDWVKIRNLNDQLVPSQICCLLEFQTTEKSVLWFVGIECQNCSTVEDITPVFPLCKYKFPSKKKGCNKAQTLRYICERVDSIIEPAMVIPVTTLSKDYLLLDYRKQLSVRFYCIPLEFLLRDDWCDMVQMREVRRTLHADDSVTRYLDGTDAIREEMYFELIATLDENKNDRCDEVDEENNLEYNDLEDDDQDAEDSDHESEDEDEQFLQQVLVDR